MSRRSRLWWSAALAVSAAGAAYLFTLPESLFFASFGFGSCTGWEAYQAFSVSLGPVMRWVPLFWLGGLPAVALACGAHWLATRRGRPLIGRVVARVVAVALLVLFGTGLVAFGVDMALDREACFPEWGGAEGLRFFAGSDAWPVVAACFVLAAVRAPKRQVPRVPGHRSRQVPEPQGRQVPRGRRSWRGAVVVLGVLAFLPVSGVVRGPITSWPCGEAEGAPGAERTFLCQLRGAGWYTEVDDRRALAFGRRQCAAFPDSLLDALTLAAICPAAAETVRSEEETRAALHRAANADHEEFCSRNRHRPRTKPVLIAHKVISTSYGVIESYEAEIPDDDLTLLDKAQENGLVAAETGHIMIRTHADRQNCVTAEVYRRRPPLEVKGWHHVVEVGYESPAGSIRLGNPMDAPSLPNLALQGKGHYRIRVHYREPDWEAWTPQHLLVQVFPGRGAPVVEHRRRS